MVFASLLFQGEIKSGQRYHISIGKRFEKGIDEILIVTKKKKQVTELQLRKFFSCLQLQKMACISMQMPRVQVKVCAV